VLNPLAWENVPNGVFGADQSGMRFFRGMRIPQESVNFSRNFVFGPESRFTLNVRVEFTNIFNRMQLPNPITVAGIGQPAINFAVTPSCLVGSGANGTAAQCADPANVLRYTGGFGSYNVVGGTNGQRTGTYVARLTF
jgi:hypothetical protein